MPSSLYRLKTTNGLSISVFPRAQIMGGYGSGRPAVHRTCEASLKLDMASPATRLALKPHASTSGTWQWSANGIVIGTIGYSWLNFKKELILRYSCDGRPVLQTVRLATTAPNYGGVRWWFECPATGTLVRTLFLPPGAMLWGSRRHHKLTYQSQRESGRDAAIFRLLTRHSGPDDALVRYATRCGRDPFGFSEERRWERREQGRARRNEIRRIARRHLR